MMMVSYTLIFSVAAIYKLHSFWMGFDLGVHEQLLWNTAHGRIAAVSPFGNTTSYLGIDIIIIELLLTPVYALVPTTETLLVVQVALAASGAIPIFLIARECSPLPSYGLLGALLYLGALPVQYAILYEFQIRTVGTVCFLWAFLFFERQQLVPFLVALLAALWTRSDAAFPVAMLGLYALIHRRPWVWIVAPPLLGLSWLVLCLSILIPAFRHDHGFQYAFIYGWLGDTPLEMVTTLLFRPMLVADHVLAPEKMSYLLELFAPFLFLPLLRPDIVLIATPSLLLNLLSADRIHWSIRYHYQAFIVPFLVIATLYALMDLWSWAQRAEPRSIRWAIPRLATIALLLVFLGSQVLVLRSPLIGLVTRPRDVERIAFAHELVQHIPPGVPVTVTSAFGPHLAQRQELYYFPGGGLIYASELVERGAYLLVDMHEIPAGYEETFMQLSESDRWHVVIEAHDFVLLERVDS